MTLVFHPAGESHTQKFSESPVASFNVEIGGDWLRRGLDQPAEFQGGRAAELGAKLFGQFQHGDAVEIEALAGEILAEVADQNAKPCDDPQPRWLLDARDLLDTRFREPLTLRSIAAEARVHPVYFAAAFRRFYHRSVGEYLRWRRLEYVREKLSERELSLADIALDAGFADQSHLTRNFKRFTGRTPGEYRTFLRFKTD